MHFVTLNDLEFAKHRQTLTIYLMKNPNSKLLVTRAIKTEESSVYTQYISHAVNILRIREFIDTYICKSKKKYDI